MGRVSAVVLGKLITSKMGIEPGTLEKAPRRLVLQYENQWAPVERLAGHLSVLPSGMLSYLADHPRGYLQVASTTCYLPGVVSMKGRPRSNVLNISLSDLESGFTCICMTAGVLDHLLGCDGARDGLCLSQGGGSTAALVELGRRIHSLFGLGHSLDDDGRASPQAYLSRSIAWYVFDRRRLNVADPLMERLLRSSLMDEDFWPHIT